MFLLQDPFSTPTEEAEERARSCLGELAGCETACRSGDYDTATEACAFYFTGSYTDVS